MHLTARNRLATYGSLAPGEVNHGQLDGLDGRWMRGHVRGRLLGAGWGAAMGFPGIVLVADGDAVDVHIFESPDLPGHWARLDAFEGDGYRRTTAIAETAQGPLDISIYEVVVEADPRLRAGEG